MILWTELIKKFLIIIMLEMYGIVFLPLLFKYCDRAYLHFGNTIS